MIEYPNIDPVAISIPISGFWGESINIYWYGLAYVVGAYLIYLRMLQTRSKFNIQMEKNDAEDLVIVYGLLCAVIGGRLGSVLFYDFHLQLQDPLYFLKIYQGGMSFHGGVIGVMVGVWIFAYRKGYKFFQLTDWLVPQVPTSGKAKEIIDHCDQLGLKLLPLGSCHPNGIDSANRTIRIAPTFPDLQSLERCMQIFSKVVKYLN